VDTGVKDKTVLVTGGSAGIGAATAVAYGREGARVALTYRSREDAAEQVVKRIEQAGGEAMAVRMDLEAHETVPAAVTAVEERWGGIDVLIANAVRWGTIPPGALRFEEVPIQEWQAALHANVVGNALLATTVLPGMRERRFGRIVFVSSAVAEEGLPGPGPYGTAKMALYGLTRSLAWEAGGDGILVNAVSVGLTLTDVERPVTTGVFDTIAARTPSKRLSTAEDVASLIVFLGSAANRNVTGEIVREGSATARSIHFT